MTLGKLELRLALAIGIDGLLAIEIDTVRHELGLNGYTMVMERMVSVAFTNIIRQGVDPLGDGIAMTDFGAFGEDGVARTDAIRGSTYAPERGRYPRGTGD